MYIESVPNRNSPPAILLRESYREGSKVRKRTLCNLSDWPTAHIEGLRGVLKGGTVIAAERALTPSRISEQTPGCNKLPVNPATSNKCSNW